MTENYENSNIFLGGYYARSRRKNWQTNKGT
jgi:hypothetical protein